MKLLTKELEKKLPPLGTTQNTDDPIAQVKFFTPTSSWTWYAIEYGPVEEVFWGLVIGLEREFEYFALSDLENAKGPYGVAIERDKYFEPKPVSECKDPCGIVQS